MKQNIHLLWISLFLMVIFRFSSVDPKKAIFQEKKNEIGNYEKRIFPSTEAKYPSFVFYNSKTGQAEFIIYGKKAEIYELNNEIWIQELKMLILKHNQDIDNTDEGEENENKTKYIEIRADLGKFNYKSFNFEAMRNVRIVILYETRIEMNYIYWNHIKQELSSKKESRVDIYQMVKNKKNQSKSKKKRYYDWIHNVGKNLIYNAETGNMEIEDSISITHQDWLKGKAEVKN